MKRLTCVVLALGLVPALYAQEYDDPVTVTESVLENDPVPSGWLEEFDPNSPNYESTPLYDKVNIPKQPMWDYPHLREADVAWMRRYERIIDSRQKINIVMQHPKLNFTDLLLKIALTEGNSVYTDRSFNETMDKKMLMQKMLFRMVIQVPDPNDPSIAVDSVVWVPVEKRKIVKYRIMEEWVFDKVHSRMIPRIIAIAPMYNPVVANGSVELPEQPLFWLRYDEIRPYLVNAEVFHPGNDAARVSYDHFFQARHFDSYIVKEPNVYDYDVAMYPEYENNGLGALLKSEDIRNDIFVMEHDLWEY